MPGESSVRTGRVTRVLNEFLRPARRGPAVPLEVAAYHVGGEPIEPDQAFGADYQPFKLGEAFGPAWDTTWFRLRGRVPLSWRGEEVMVGFAVGQAGSTGFGAESLLFLDGRPRQGLSPNHREHRLFEVAAGGEEVELFVETAANPPSPFGANPWPLLLPDYGGRPLFTLQRADLHVRRAAFDAFFHDFRIALELLLELPEGDPRRARILFALDRACSLLELPEIGESWREAQPLVREALGHAGAPDRHRVSAVGHAHIDTAWLWPLRETVRKCARTFATVLELMDRYPEFRFVVPAAQHLAWMRDRYPALWARLKERAAEGRIEPTGSMWVEADCNIPSGESLVRQLVFGKRFFRQEFGIDTVDVWLPDVFGYSAALPQIMAKTGVRFFLTQKLSWNQYNVLPHHTFLWEGLDGSRVLAHFPPADTYVGQMTVAELRFAEANFLDHARSRHSLYPFGWGDGGGGPTEVMLESARRLADVDGVPKVVIEGPRRFFEHVEEELVDPPVWVGELYLELHRGTYTTQAKTKWGNRRCELALRDAELWTTLLDAPSDYPAHELEEAWRTLLVHQFHDIIPGSGINWVYRDTEAAHADVLERAETMVTGALRRASDLVRSSGCHHPVVVWNSLGHERHEVIEVEAPSGLAVAVDEEGRARGLQRVAPDRALVAVTVPPFGYARYDFCPGKPRSETEVSVSPRSLSNGTLEAHLDDRGLLVSLVDQKANREVLAKGRPANVLVLHPDYPNFYDAWDVDSFYDERAEELVEVEAIEVAERGPLRSSIRVRRRFGHSAVDQLIRLDATARHLEFVTTVEWHETNRFLRVEFPLAVRSERATYEVQFGHVERPTHTNTSWDAARFEVCAQRWADLSEPGYGVALLNDSKYGYRASGNVLSLSLLRSPTWPDPEADRGTQRFTYRLLPHAGDLREAGVVQAGLDLNVPLRAVSIDPKAGGRAPVASLFSLSAPNVVLEALKRADDDPTVVVARLYEAWGCRGMVTLTCPFEVAEARRANLMEEGGELLQSRGSHLSFMLEPFEIATIVLRPGTGPTEAP